LQIYFALKVLFFIFNEAFDSVSPRYTLLAMEVPSTSKKNAYPWLGEVPGMKEWVDDREIQNMELHGFEIENKDFELTVAVDRNDIEDDQYGIYKPLIQQLGISAKEHPDQLVFELLQNSLNVNCYDGKPFFAVDHPVHYGSGANLVEGTNPTWYLMNLKGPIKPFIFQRRKPTQFISLDKSNDENVFLKKKYLYGVDDRKNVGVGLWRLAFASKQELKDTNYAAARAAMMSYKKKNKQPIINQPTHLIVGPSLESQARALIEAQFNSSGASNIWFKTATLVVIPELG